MKNGSIHTANHSIPFSCQLPLALARVTEPSYGDQCATKYLSVDLQYALARIKGNSCIFFGHRKMGPQWFRVHSQQCLDIWRNFSLIWSFLRWPLWAKKWQATHGESSQWGLGEMLEYDNVALDLQCHKSKSYSHSLTFQELVWMSALKICNF